MMMTNKNAFLLKFSEMESVESKKSHSKAITRKAKATIKLRR